MWHVSITSSSAYSEGTYRRDMKNCSTNASIVAHIDSALLTEELEQPHRKQKLLQIVTRMCKMSLKLTEVLDLR